MNRLEKLKKWFDWEERDDLLYVSVKDFTWLMEWVEATAKVLEKCDNCACQRMLNKLERDDI